jgi:hypothetical protein
MNLAGFWDLVERSARDTSDPDERAEWLAEAVTDLAVDDLADFQGHLDDQMRRVSSWLMWHAAVLIEGGGCSDDGFSRFRAWLVGLGQDAVDQIADDPDRLADRPEVQRLAGRHPRSWAEEEWPDWEDLEFMAVHEYKRRLGDHASIYDVLRTRWAGVEVSSPRTAEDRWDHHDVTESHRRLPRLTAMFPPPGPFRATPEEHEESLR